LGCGKIARKFASDLQWVSDAKLVAIGAREQSTADAFAEDFPVEYKHNSYKALAENPEVDVIYIATPHALHYEHVMLCLQHKKAVLVEKAFAINYSQAKHMIDFAISQQTFLMEAFWTRFLPHYLKVKEMIAEGRIGTIRYINAEFGFKPTPPVSQRIYDPALGGGSLLDVGVYPVFLALDLLGKPDFIQASMVPAPSGVDEQCSIQFKYNNGAIANLFSSFATNLAGPTTELEFYPGVVDSKQTIAFEKARGNGYEYEAQHVNNCIKRGLVESPLRTHKDTLLLTQTLDQIRSIVGIRYPAD